MPKSVRLLLNRDSGVLAEPMEHDPNARRGIEGLRVRLAALPRAPTTTDHLHDPDFVARFVARSGVVEGDDDEIAPEPKRQRKRKPSLAAALRQAAATGVTVNGATVKPDGSVALTFGERDDTATNGNPWDEVLTNVAH